MLSLITNTTGITPCESNTVFGGKYQTGLQKIFNQRDTLAKKTVKAGNNAPSFIEKTVDCIASLFNRRLEFDSETGKLLRINKYKDGKLAKVRHLDGNLRNLKSIDEYKNGKIFKTTSYDRLTKKPQLMIEFSEKGNDRITEFYPDGKTIKSVQFDKNDILDSKMCLDETGKMTKYIKYNSDETVMNTIIYEPDKTILESYDHGILKTSTITYNKTSNKVELTYDESKKIISAREEGKGYETYFAYENGKKAWSGTYFYGEGPVAYKRVEYDDFGSPKVAYLYNNDQTLYGKTEFLEAQIRVHTKYTKDGQVKSVETVDTRTGKVTRQYRKVKTAVC